jgi:hypothetical protein
VLGKVTSNCFGYHRKAFVTFSGTHDNDHSSCHGRAA